MKLESKTKHTTLNLSQTLITQAMKLLGDSNKTQVIHEALRRLVYAERLKNHAEKWGGKLKLAAHG